MKLRKLFLVAGLAAIAMSMSAQRAFDVKLYNGRPPYDNGDSQDTAKVRVYLPKKPLGVLLSFVLVADTPLFLWTKKVMIGESSSRIKV